MREFIKRNIEPRNIIIGILLIIALIMGIIYLSNQILEHQKKILKTQLLLE